MGKECCFNVISRFFGIERHVTRERTPSRETTRNTMSIQYNLVMTSLHWYDTGRDDYSQTPSDTAGAIYEVCIKWVIFSLVPDLLFDCSRVLEYTKIRTVLESNPSKLL